MAAEVESLMYVREAPWHGLGTKVMEAPTSVDAIKLAELDWQVNPRPVYTDGILIPNIKANVRDKDSKVLGLVTDKYKIVQNSEAFAFTDMLIGEGCTYETAGSLRDGKRIFLLAKMPQQKILDEAFDPYICFTNTFDGTGAVQAIMTPIRVVCMNTLNLALDKAKRKWSTRHVGDMNSKLEEAKYTLGLANKYMQEFEVVADKLANTKVSEDEAHMIIDNMFPIKEEASERAKENIINSRNKFMVCMMAPDILKYKGTAYQIVQAASDFATHMAPNRMTDTYKERNFSKVLDGHWVIDEAFLQMMKKVNKAA